MTGNDGDKDGEAHLARLDRDFARLMEKLDRIKGISDPASKDDAEPEIDPELERDLQLVILKYLSEHKAAELTPAEMEDDKALAQAFETHIKPLFDALFATAQEHAKAANEAIREGRDPSMRRASSKITLDLSDLLEDDS